MQAIAGCHRNNLAEYFAKDGSSSICLCVLPLALALDSYQARKCRTLRFEYDNVDPRSNLRTTPHMLTFSYISYAHPVSYTSYAHTFSYISYTFSYISYAHIFPTPTRKSCEILYNNQVLLMD